MSPTGTDGTFPKRGSFSSVPVVLGVALVVGGMPFWLAGAGLRAYFTADDMVNLYGYWSKPWTELLIANVAYFSPAYRPLGGLFYRSMFAVIGFDPFPFRVACFAIMLVNLGLAYAAARSLAGSRQIALLTALIGSYHAGFDDLYYNTGTVYDLLCFTCYVGALVFYIRTRRRAIPFGWRRTALLAGMYICALNSKEMAVTLPLAILVYEWIYHRPELTRRGLLRWAASHARAGWILAALTLPYICGKLSGASPFTGIPEYELHIGLARYVSTYQYYLDRMFYRLGAFSFEGVLLLWAMMLAVAALSRLKGLRFSFLLLLLSVLPVIFVTPRGSLFVLYIPFFFWCLYAATLLVWIGDGLVAGLARMGARFAALRLKVALGAVTFAVAALVLGRAHQAHTPQVPLESILQTTKEQLHGLLPRLPANSRILFLDDPFEIDDWSPFLLIRLSYGERTILMHRAKMMKQRPSLDEIRGYDVVLTYREGRLLRVDPAQAGASGSPQEP